MITNEEIILIQSKLRAPKDQYNAFGKYKFRSAESILEAVKPLLAETKTFLIINDSIQMMGDRFYVCATVKLYNQGGKVIAESTAFAREPLSKKGADESQITGAASSYARKYALNGLLLIDDTKDADSTNKHGKDDQENKPPNNKPQPNNLTKEKVDIVDAIKEKMGIMCMNMDNNQKRNMIKSELKVNVFAELFNKDINNLKNILENLK